MFTTTLTLEERIARAQTQLAKAKENRRKAYEKAAKVEKKIERLIARAPGSESPRLWTLSLRLPKKLPRSPNDDERRT